MKVESGRMRSRGGLLLATLLLGLSAGWLAACQEENRAQEAMEELRDEAGDAADEIEDEVDDAT
jgi:hypothetical protein